MGKAATGIFQMPRRPVKADGANQAVFCQSGILVDVYTRSPSSSSFYTEDWYLSPHITDEETDLRKEDLVCAKSFTWEDPWGKGMATLAEVFLHRESHWTEEPGKLSMGSGNRT